MPALSSSPSSSHSPSSPDHRLIQNDREGAGKEILRHIFLLPCPSPHPDPRSGPPLTRPPRVSLTPPCDGLPLGRYRSSICCLLHSDCTLGPQTQFSNGQRSLHRLPTATPSPLLNPWKEINHTRPTVHKGHYGGLVYLCISFPASLISNCCFPHLKLRLLHWHHFSMTMFIVCSVFKLNNTKCI